jgi:hypothetical protein
VTVPAGCGETEIGSAFARVDELPKRSHIRNRNAVPDPCQLKPVAVRSRSSTRYRPISILLWAIFLTAT